MGMVVRRLSIKGFAISPLLIGRRKLIKLIKMLIRKILIAVKVLMLQIGFKKSFQRTPRIENAERKAMPERRARMRPLGVARFCSST
jgi:hypothetical protein